MSEKSRRGHSSFPTAVEEKKTLKNYQSKRSQSWIVRHWRYWYTRLRRLQGKPEYIARGIATGVFAGFFPFFGFQIILGVLLATVLRGHKIAAVAGTWISNPLTYVPLFIFNFKVGNLLLGWNGLPANQLDVESWSTITESGIVVARNLLAGCATVGAIAAVCSYFSSLWIFSRWRRARRGSRKLARYTSKRE